MAYERVFTEEDIKALQKALEDAKAARKEIERAKRAGIDVSDQEARLNEYERQLKNIYRVYVQEPKAR